MQNQFGRFERLMFMKLSMKPQPSPDCLAGSTPGDESPVGTVAGIIRALVLVAVLGLAVAACGVPSASENSLPVEPTTDPTPTTDPAPTARPAPTPTPLDLATDETDNENGVTASSDNDDTDTATGEAGRSPRGKDKDSASPTEREPTPTATPPAMPTTAAIPSATPAPQPTSRPSATATATAVPAATPTVASVVRPVVDCSIAPERIVGVGEALVFQASSTPGQIPVAFTFDHGDGTLDARARSDAYFAAPGQYPVSLRWASAGHDGSVACGVVTVANGDGCWIGLGPADGIGWWCGNYFCPDGLAVAGCPGERVWGCFTGMDGQRRCIERGAPNPEPQCLVGFGPEGGFSWYCGGQWCDASAPHAGCRPYPIYGCHPTVDGQTIWIDPPPDPVSMTCTVSHTAVAVGQVITLTAHQLGPGIGVDVVFNHGDGTRDPRWVAEAYYAQAGTYTVTLDWSASDGTAGTAICGTVRVG